MIHLMTLNRRWLICNEIASKVLKHYELELKNIPDPSFLKRLQFQVGIV